MNCEFHFDFGSPNCFFAHRALPLLQARTGVTFTYAPILLGGAFKLTNNKSPIEQFAGVKHKLAYSRQEMARFQKRHGITDFTWNKAFPINTLPLMRGATYAQDKPWFGAYLDTVFDALWVRNLNMGDPGVIRDALDAADLPGGEIFEGAQAAEVKQALIDATAASVERGNFGAPTFFIDDEMFFGKDSLWEVEEAIGLRQS